MKEIQSIEQFQALLKGDKPILVDFYADWCGPCRMLLPTVEKLAEEYEKDFEIVKVNVDANRELAQQFRVRSIPALFFIKNQEIMEQLTGLQTEASLTLKIEEYKQRA